MARETRIEKKSRTTKRWHQGALTWDISSAAFVGAVGKIPRLDIRGFPVKHGADTTAIAYTEQA
jgi:hypothetical protein